MDAEKIEQQAPPPAQAPDTNATQENNAETATDGPKLSKNEQKRLEKLKKLEAEKAEKAAKKAEKEKEKPAATKQEEILDPTQYFENRSKMITELKKSPDTYPYPHKFHVSLTITEFIKKYSTLTAKAAWLEE